MSIESNYGDIVYMSNTQVLGKTLRTNTLKIEMYYVCFASSGNADQKWVLFQKKKVYTPD